MPERFDFDVTLGRSGRPRDESAPLRLLLLGDFSGKPAADRPPLASRPTVKVDVDTLASVMKRFSPGLQIDGVDMQFREVDDFHPDRLFTGVAGFRSLQEKRANPPIEEDDTLNRLLGKPSAAPATPPAKPATSLDALIHNIVAPHIVKDTSHAKLHTEVVDGEIGQKMRAVLHDPQFQSLEAAWRGVQWLVSNLELDENLQLHLFDVTRDELVADVVAAQGKVANTGLAQALIDRWRNVPGGQGWSAIATLLQFGPSDTDVSLLAALGLLAARAGAPLLGGADLQVAAESNTSPSWTALRKSEVAPWIALAAPRLLLRLPYGSRGEAVQGFAFEEFTGEPAHEHFLWGQASLAMVLLIGRAFTARGWEMELGDERDIEDLPAFIVERDGERQLQAGAEHFLTERQIQALLDAGIVPIASRRDRNAAVLIRFQSIAQPPAPLVW